MTSSDDPIGPATGQDPARPGAADVPPTAPDTTGTPDPTRTPGPTGSEQPSTGRRAAERPATPGTGPELSDPGAGGGKTAGLWISLILGAIVLVLLLIFVLQNNQSARFVYFATEFDLPLGIAMLLAAIAGALVMALVGSVRMFQMSWTIRKMRKQQEKIHRATR